MSEKGRRHGWYMGAGAELYVLIVHTEVPILPILVD
jgi:hypothetical protein